MVIGFLSIPLKSAPQKLFVDESLINAIQKEMKILDSHHHKAFQALKWRVKQGDLKVYKEDVNRYNRSYLAQELALACVLSEPENERQKYADLAFKAIKDIYESSAQERFPHEGYGLSRAMMQLGLALPYNWCREYWTVDQVEFAKRKINEALDSWLHYDHANFWDEKGSNWVAVCRGGELVLLLAAEQKENRRDRYDFLIEQLRMHMQNGYGDHGASQEGMGYVEYGGVFLLKAVFAAASSGDSSLLREARNHAWWKLAMYAESFQPHERKFLMTGVAGSSGIDEGWTSFLLHLVPQEELPYYLWFYDRHMGRKFLGSEQEKFDAERAGTIWSILYYPIGLNAKDPSTKYVAGIQDSNGYFFFRNRWRDENDILFSMMADEHHHGHAWDQPEVFALNLMAYNTRFIGGPSKKTDNQYYSSLLIDSTYNFKGAVGLSGKTLDWESGDDYGYVAIDGGQLYDALGVEKAVRRSAVKFFDDQKGIICIMDEIKAKDEKKITWQLNLGDDRDEEQIEVIQSGNHFRFIGNQGVVDGWCYGADTFKFGDLKDPFQIHFTGRNTNIIVLLFLHNNAEKISPPRFNQSEIEFYNHRIRLHENSGKMFIQSID